MTGLNTLQKTPSDLNLVSLRDHRSFDASESFAFHSREKIAMKDSNVNSTFTDALLNYLPANLNKESIRLQGNFTSILQISNVRLFMHRNVWFFTEA